VCVFRMWDADYMQISLQAAFMWIIVLLLLLSNFVYRMWLVMESCFDCKSCFDLIDRCVCNARVIRVCVCVVLLLLLLCFFTCMSALILVSVSWFCHVVLAWCCQVQTPFLFICFYKLRITSRCYFPWLDSYWWGCLVLIQ